MLNTKYTQDNKFTLDNDLSIEDKLEYIEGWWNDEELVTEFISSKSTNSIYIKFKNKKWVRISDHDKALKFNWIDINLNIWNIHSILTRISGNKITWGYKRYPDIEKENW